MTFAASTPLAMDIWVVGAGMAGLLCAQWLRHWGYRVGVVDKSRGLGGRVATRRLPGTCADHGARFLEVQGALTQEVLDLCRAGDQPALVPWAGAVGQVATEGTGHVLSPTPRYVAPLGMTAIAKILATNLPIARSQRVIRLEQAEGLWHLHSEATAEGVPPVLTAQAVVLAIPAPQAAPLLEPLVAQGLPKAMLEQVQAVTYDPCLTAIATYPTDPTAGGFSALQFEADPVLAWMSWEGSKRSPDAPTTPAAAVIHSSARFATAHLDAADLTAAGEALLAAAAHHWPQVRSPQHLQLHRWRYAFVCNPLAQCPASPLPLPLVCCGDWCQGHTLEAALQAGAQAAQMLNQQLAQRPVQATSLATLLNFGG